MSSLIKHANQSEKDTRTHLGKILSLLTGPPAVTTDAPVGETQMRTPPPTPTPTETPSSPRINTPPPSPHPNEANEAKAKAQADTEAEAAAKAEKLKQLNEPQDQLRAAVAR